jgi:hypothetical protein
VPVMYARLAGFHVYRRETIRVDLGERAAPEKALEETP